MDRASIQHLFRLYKIPIGIIVVYILYELSTLVFDQSGSTKAVARAFLIASVSWALLFNRRFVESIYPTIGILVALSIFAVAIFIFTEPVSADFFAQEDGLVENMSAVFLIIGSLLTLHSGLVFHRRKQTSTAIAAFILSFIFFIICMEEISWGQRILNISTPASIEQLNDQSELNFHNLATGLTERLYYVGAFILLTILPFFRNTWANLLSKLNLHFLAPLLPSMYLAYPFVATSAFMKHEPDTPLFVGTLVISIILLLYSFSKINSWSRNSAYIILSMVAVTFCAAIIYTLSHATHGTRPWFPSEYRELYIAMGIAFYGLYLAIDTRKK